MDSDKEIYCDKNKLQMKFDKYSLYMNQYVVLYVYISSIYVLLSLKTNMHEKDSQSNIS